MGNHLHVASPTGIQLTEAMLAAVWVRSRQKPERVIADKGNDSDPMRERLHRRGIELISPHRRNRSKPSTQGSFALRRYRHRWIIERTFTWFGNYHRPAMRWDRSFIIYIYNPFFHIACFTIVLRRVVQ